MTKAEKRLVLEIVNLAMLVSNEKTGPAYNVRLFGSTPGLDVDVYPKGYSGPAEPACENVGNAYFGQPRSVPELVSIKRKLQAAIDDKAVLLAGGAS